MRHLEDYGPLIGALLVMVILWSLGGLLGDTSETLRSLAASAFTLSGIFLGFLLTIISVMSTVASRRMRFVKQSGNYPRLVKYLKRAIYLNIAVVIVSFVLTMIQNLLVLFSSYAFVAFSFLVSYMVFVSVRFSIIFTILLSDPEDA